MNTHQRRARLLVRCYPPAWRARYGDEFVQLLVDEMAERPRSVSRTADVVRNGLIARLASAGLSGDTFDPRQQVRAGLGALSIASTAFLAAGVAIWAQLTIGWQWSAPAASATRTGMLVMSGAMAGFALVAILGAAPLVWTICREVAAGRGRGLVLPLLAVAVGGSTLVAGSIHFGHGWPGTGGHPWAGRDIVPVAVARFCWAATLWITSYWAHPGALRSFPASEIGWMVVSPVALAAVLIGAAKTLRRLQISSRVLRYESWLGLVAGSVMAVFLAGAGSWIVSGSPAPRGLFRVGAIDCLGIVVMAGALIVACRAAQRALAARPTAGSRDPAGMDAPSRHGRRRWRVRRHGGCRTRVGRARCAPRKAGARQARRRLFVFRPILDVRSGRAIAHRALLFGPPRPHDRLSPGPPARKRATAGDLAPRIRRHTRQRVRRREPGQRARRPTRRTLAPPVRPRLGLGRPPRRIGAIGISMGGYGALLLAEKHPRLISAVAAISPAGVDNLRAGA